MSSHFYAKIQFIFLREQILKMNKNNLILFSQLIINGGTTMGKQNHKFYYCS